MKKICIITSTRAEYSLLKPLMSFFHSSDEFSLQIIVTGSHLSKEFGETIKYIRKDGFDNLEEIEILLSSDSPVGTSKAMGLAIISFSEFFSRLESDLAVFLGDRSEIFAAMSAALVMKIPIAHLHGGEKTEGAYDDSFRHAMTKLAHLHFTSTQEYKNRVLQLGESSDRVFNVGALGVEHIVGNIDKIKQGRFFNKTDLTIEKYFVVLFHPETLSKMKSLHILRNLLKVISGEKKYSFVFIHGNFDVDGIELNKEVDGFTSSHENCTSFKSLASNDFLNLLYHSEGLVGNSSCGIIEAPSLGIPSINIGNRQKGRVRASSVIQSGKEYEEILSSMTELINYSEKEVHNPYFKKGTSSLIVKEIKGFLKMSKDNQIIKKFSDLKIEQ